MTGSPWLWTLIASTAVFDLVGLFLLWRRRKTQDAQSWRERNGADAGVSLLARDQRRGERRTNPRPSGAQKRLPAHRLRNKTGT